MHEATWGSHTAKETAHNTKGPYTHKFMRNIATKNVYTDNNRENFFLIFYNNYGILSMSEKISAYMRFLVNENVFGKS